MIILSVRYVFQELCWGFYLPGSIRFFVELAHENENNLIMSTFFKERGKGSLKRPLFSESIEARINAAYGELKVMEAQSGKISVLFRRILSL